MSNAARLLDKSIEPSYSDIVNIMGKEAVERLCRLDSFFKDNYDINCELKFPFGNNYGWGYKYSHKTKHLCYVFFEKGSFTVTIAIGKGELQRLYQELDSMLPKTKQMWEKRYPCGDGGWMHYRVECDDELNDIQKLVCIKKKPKSK